VRHAASFASWALAVAGDPEVFLRAIAEAPSSRGVLVGSGLELDGELLQLCAFSSDESGARTHIEPPSRRR
jgi:hypothetical protein